MCIDGKFPGHKCFYHFSVIKYDNTNSKLTGNYIGSIYNGNDIMYIRPEEPFVNQDQNEIKATDQDDKSTDQDDKSSNRELLQRWSRRLEKQI